jgi:hypothetical protein
MTEAEKTVLDNTSGTNTGDETVAVISLFIISHESMDGPAECVFRSFVLQRCPNHEDAQANAEDARKTCQNEFHFILLLKEK